MHTHLVAEFDDTFAWILLFLYLEPHHLPLCVMARRQLTRRNLISASRGLVSEHEFSRGRTLCHRLGEIPESWTAQKHNQGRGCTLTVLPVSVRHVLQNRYTLTLYRSSKDQFDLGHIYRRLSGA